MPVITVGKLTRSLATNHLSAHMTQFTVIIINIAFTRGIAWAPACGQAIAELVVDGHCSCINLAPFDPSRFTPSKTGSRGRKQQGMDIGEQW